MLLVAVSALMSTESKTLMPLLTYTMLPFHTGNENLRSNSGKYGHIHLLTQFYVSSASTRAMTEVGRKAGRSSSLVQRS